MTKASSAPRPKASPLLWLLPLLGILAGAAVAYAVAPRYQAPPAADEARLRQRAVEYYQASRTFKYDRIVQLFTPAYQMEGSDSIQRLADQFAGKFATFDSATQKELRTAAESIKPERLKVLVDGDWAQTSGKYDYGVEGQQVELPLEDVVWVRTAGDWWIFQLQNPEILRYGLPPEPIRQALLRPDEKFELENLPDSLRDVPKEGEERYDPANAMTEEDAARIREEEQSAEQGGAADEPGGEAGK